MNFYDTFIKLCAKKGIKPAEISKKTGISKASISNWKQRNGKPSDTNLHILADFFGVSVDYLLKNDEKNEPVKDNDRFVNDYYMLDAEDRETVNALISSLLGKAKYNEKENVG